MAEIDGTWIVVWTKRDLTADEMAPPPPDPLDTLLDALAKATTLAQIRAAATKAADL